MQQKLRFSLLILSVTIAVFLCFIVPSALGTILNAQNDQNYCAEFTFIDAEDPVQDPNAIYLSGFVEDVLPHRIMERASALALARNEAEKLSGHLTLTIDVPGKKLTVLSNGELIRTFYVAVGEADTPSPIGEWFVSHKAVNWGTGFGTRWLGLNVPWGIYGIHGTNKPWSIGNAASHGCIRMHNKDVEWLYKHVRVGTEVKILKPFSRKQNPPVLKMGQSNQSVVDLQLLLRRAGVYIGVADGRFGERTNQAVILFQELHHLPTDGVVTAAVWKSLWTYVDAHQEREDKATPIQLE